MFLKSTSAFLNELMFYDFKKTVVTFLNTTLIRVSDSENNSD